VRSRGLSFRRPFAVALLAAGLMVTGVLAFRAARSPAVSLVAHAEVAAGPFLEPYPAGRWRALERGTLANLVLWVSHILIRHEGSVTSACFAPPEWGTDAAPARRRDAALAMASDVARAATPDDFARLASLYSEDTVTRHSAGSLGGIAALELASDPAVLDALESTPIGSVSRVVESRYGFHVLYRRPPPPEATVTGAHIVIGFDEARWLHRFVARGPVPARSRAAAFRRADELFAQLQAHPERFDALVAELSEHRDAAWGGDIGTWSTRERSAFPRQVELLAGLEVGEAAAPIESLFGVELLVRRPNVERRTLAMSALRLRYDPVAAPGETRHRAHVEQEARAIASQLARAPERFESVAARRCCRVDVQWQEGRGYAALTAPVAALAQGQVAGEPIEWESSFYIPRRIDAAALPPLRGALLDFPHAVSPSSVSPSSVSPSSVSPSSALSGPPVLPP
jgi:hypothetical protein